MILQDRALRTAIANGDIIVNPLGERAIQPASIDLRLGTRFRRFRGGAILDPLESPDMVEFDVPIGEILPVLDNEFLLGETIEWVEVPADLLGRLDGRSTMGRFGWLIHATAGFFDPGFKGQPTLEIKNISGRTNRLRPGMRVCQMSFEVMLGAAEIPYGDARLGSKYQGQTRVTSPLVDVEYRA